MLKRLAFRTVAAATAAALMLALVGWFALSRFAEMQASGGQVMRAYAATTAIERVRSAMAEVEFRQHEFLLTEEAAALPRYRRAVSDLRERVDELNGAVSDARQRERVTQLRGRVSEALANLDAEVSAVKDSGRDVHMGVAAVLDELNDAEALILRARIASGEASAKRESVAIWIGIGFAGAFMIVAGLVIAVGILKRHRAERALEASEARLRAMFDSLLTGVFIADDRARILTVNPAFAQMVGLPVAGLPGRSVADFVVLPEGAPEAVIAAEGNRIAGSTTRQQMRRADGRLVPVEVALAKFVVGSDTFFVANWCDVTERVEVDRMKDEFVSVVSHELRTPLTSVRGALQLVLSDPPEFRDPDHAPLLGIALNNCERLIRIINDILDVSKIESGKLELRLKPCDVGALASTATQNVAEIARASNVTIALDLEPALPPVRGDVDRLVQVVVNLLSNALKFAPPGSTVEVRGRRDGGHVILSITDHGPGIAAADIGKLFAKFKQLDASTTRKVGGTGLGLSIVKALVEQHGGTVRVESRVGEGATFVVALPIAEVPAAAAPLAPIAARPQSGHRTILIADDDGDVRTVLRKQLESAGYRVIEAADGEAAIVAAGAESPDLITMDLMMPGMGGLGAIRKLAADPQTRHIPVVIVSAAVQDVAVEPDFAIVSKPIDGDRLLREIRKLIGSDAHATLLVAEDDDDLRTVLAQSLCRGGFHVVAAPDGAEACRLFDATRCDAVVLDLHMPHVDGFKVIEHVRASARAATPIVVVSGSNTGAGESRALQLGANLYLAKPVDPASLIRELSSLVP